MNDEEQAKEFRQKLTSALLIVNAIFEEAQAKGFDVRYTSNLVNGKFETKIDVSKKL